jgi:hypothetical protein
MAVSGSFNFSQNRDELINDAFITCGVEGPYDTPEAEDTSVAVNELNRMLKGWQADGLHLWIIRPSYLFLEKDKREYDLGSDHLTESFTSTEIKTAGSSSDVNIDVDSTTGMTAADNCLIALDDGTLHETTIASVTDSDTFVIDDSLPSAVAVDQPVFFYTTKAQRPLRVQQVVYHDYEGNTDTRMYQISRDEFWNLSSKATDARPSQWYFDPQLTNSKLRIYGEPSTVKDYLIVLAHFPFDDMDAAGDDFAFPNEWYDAIHYNLAYRLGIKYRTPRDRLMEIEKMAYVTKDRAMGWDSERSDINIRPDSQWLQG